MYCRKCGAALPNRGYICKSCGTMMDSDQIKEQKAYMLGSDKNGTEVELNSDKYSTDPVERDYEKRHDNSKILGILLIALVMILLVIFAIFKVM